MNSKIYKPENRPILQKKYRSEMIEIVQTHAMKVRTEKVIEISETERERIERNHLSEEVDFFVLLNDLESEPGCQNLSEGSCPE